MCRCDSRLFSKGATIICEGDPDLGNYNVIANKKCASMDVEAPNHPTDGEHANGINLETSSNENSIRYTVFANLHWALLVAGSKSDSTFEVEHCVFRDNKVGLTLGDFDSPACRDAYGAGWSVWNPCPRGDHKRNLM